MGLKPIFEYTDYRRYLQDYYVWAKESKRGFSHRDFLIRAGMSGPNYLKRVMEGAHNLTDNSIPKFAQALELDAAESEFFRFLVYFNQAKTLEEKDRFFERLMELKTPHSRYLLEKAQYDYYTEWFNVAIRELLACVDTGDPKEIAKQLAPPVIPKKVKKALELLESLKLVEKRTDGTFKPSSNHVFTEPGIQSLLIPKFHQAMAKLAEEAITRFSKDERYFSGTTMSLSEQSYAQIIEIIRNARKEIVQKVGEEATPSRVYHLNMQLFPLSTGKLKRKRQ